MYVVSESLSYICSKKQLRDALKHIDDVKKGVNDRVDAEVNMGESFQDYS